MATTNGIERVEVEGHTVRIHDDRIIDCTCDSFFCTDICQHLPKAAQARAVESKPANPIDQAATNYNVARKVVLKEQSDIKYLRDLLKLAEGRLAAAEQDSSRLGKQLIDLLDAPPRASLADTLFNEYETENWKIKYLQGCGLTVEPREQK